ncbi:hypothetical protein [Citricoccus sp. NR2]|uniref:hypothetical protein n=1 Tax=Citricoccus sp. NR2 TaxID=3004095 RepID=UPI0022DE8493|nr:hypothetical protein [Citricoccus sp. NR2]WBL18789.1 hypothetical protein O1A05_13685 [Citricoccus sp. NR2]
MDEPDEHNFWTNIDASDYQDRWIISGKGTTRDMWVGLAWEGIDPDRPFTLPDGTDFLDLLSEGRFSSIADKVWLQADKKGRMEDVLWTCTMSYTAISTRLVKALKKFTPEGIQSWPLEVRSKRGEKLSDDYHLIVISPTASDDSPVRSFPYKDLPSASFDVTSEVFDHLKEQGITGFSAEHGLDYIKTARENEETERDWERKKATGDLTDYERELLEEERQLIAEAEAYDRENPRP